MSHWAFHSNRWVCHRCCFIYLRKWRCLLHWWQDWIVHRRRFEIKKPQCDSWPLWRYIFFWMSIYQINLSCVCDIDFFWAGFCFGTNHMIPSNVWFLEWRMLMSITNCPIKSLIQDLQEYTTEKVTLYLKVQLDSSNPIMALRCFLNYLSIKFSEDTVILQNVPPLCRGPNKIPVFTIDK